MANILRVIIPTQIKKDGDFFAYYCEHPKCSKVCVHHIHFITNNLSKEIVTFEILCMSCYEREVALFDLGLSKDKEFEMHYTIMEMYTQKWNEFVRYAIIKNEGGDLI